MNPEKSPQEQSPFFKDRDVQRLIESHKILPEDFGLLQELSRFGDNYFDENFFIETLHNWFNLYQERSEKQLEMLMERDDNEKRKKLCGLALKFCRKYGWDASYSMVRVLENYFHDKKDTR